MSLAPYTLLNKVRNHNEVWDAVALDWVAMTQPLVSTDTLAVNADITDDATRLLGKVSITKTALTASAPAAVSVGVASGIALAANASRKGLTLVNTSDNHISLGIGAAAVLYSGITLNPKGGVFWMDEYSFSTAAIYAIASGATSNLGIMEFT